MNIGYIAAPLLGAIIGYFTNYLAVKMLFRPYEEKHIGKLRIPFTPGIIPKGQPRLARAIADTVSDTLLTEEDLKKTLLEDKVKDAVARKCQQKVDEIKESGLDLESFITSKDLTSNLEPAKEKLETFVVGKIMNRLLAMNIGDVAAEKVLEAGGDYLKSSFIGSLIGPGVLNQFVEPVREKANQMVKEEGYDMVRDAVHQEIEDLLHQPMDQVVDTLSLVEMDLGQMAVSIYERIVNGGISDWLKEVGIKKIVEDKVNQMKPKELEELTFAVMKKELNAIINLGALIGFAIGCINIIFLVME